MEGEGGEKNEQLVYGPADVAARLGVSPAGLRRLAMAYERVYGELGRDPRLGRVWPQEAVVRLERTRNMVHTGKAVSVESALTSLASGDPSANEPRPQAVARARGTEHQARALEALVGELRALRHAIEEQNRRLHALEEENRQLRAALPPPREEQPPPRWGRAVRLSQPLRRLTSRVARGAASGGGGAPSRGLWARGRSLLARTVRRRR